MKKIKMTKNNDMTFAQGYDKFIYEHCILNNLREGTIRHYNEIITYSWYKYYDKESLLSELSQDDINSYVIWLRGNNTKDTTINIYLKAIKTIIRYFRAKEWVDDKLVVNLIKTNSEPINGYSDREIELLIKKPNLSKCGFVEYRNWMIINFLCGTGCRRSTLINIHIEDINLVNNTVYYRHTKNRKCYSISITKYLADILGEYINYLPSECDYLFPTILGEQMRVRSLTHTIDDYNTKRGVSTGIHKFRHWFAKKSIMNGMDLITLQRILGHSSLDMVKRYVNLLTGDTAINEINYNPLESMIRKSSRIDMKSHKR